MLKSSGQERLHSHVDSYEEGRTEVNSKSPGNEPQCLLTNQLQTLRKLLGRVGGDIDKLPCPVEN